MIDPRTNESGTREYINEVNSTVLVAVDNIYPNIKNVISSEQLEKVIIVNPPDSLPLGMRMISKLKPSQTDYSNKKIISWNKFIKDGKQFTEDYATVYEKDLPISIVHTGGTTGFPKGVLLTNDNYNAMVEQFRYSGIDFKREHTWLGMIPLFFAYGGGVGLHHPLSIGMEIKVIPMFNPEKMDELVLKYKANHMAIIPSYYESIIHSPKAICEEKLPDYCVPTYWKVKDNLPLTNAGKIDFRALEVEANEEMRIERETLVMTRKLKLSK